MLSRPPLDLSPRRKPTSGHLEVARHIVHHSRVLEVLSPHLDAEVGRHRRLSLEGLLVMMQVNALERHHEAHLIEVARLLNSLSDEERLSLGITSWDERQAYLCVVRLFGKLCKVLGAGIPGIDATWFANSIARASVPKRYLTSRSVAVDGTDVETWGAFQGSVTVKEYDGDALEDSEGDEAPTAPHRARKAKVLKIGPDGRKQYTADPDARAGHRSSSGKHSSGYYIGYELHLAVQAREVRSTNYIDKTALSEEVPNVVTTLNLTPAGTHRARSIVPHLIASKESGQELREVIWDPGYSLCKPETTTYPLMRAGIEQTFQVSLAQRGIRPFSKEALLLDGQLYSQLLPADLRDLAMPPINVPESYRAGYEKHFNRRARWRLVRHAAPDQDGATRWRCPFCAGLLRSRSFPRTMRGSRNAPLVFLPESIERCCCGTVTAPAADLPLAQRIPFGTTAWRISMNRRYAAESVNAAFKGGFVNVTKGFLRVLGLTKVTVLLSFTVAAVNLDRIRSFEAKRAEEDKVVRRHRRRRRVGTLTELIGPPKEPPLLSAAPPG